ncbi:MAG: hypothetical protein AUK63_270 [bacterium P3]|nr:MAG: hypothetical protein AUK63_270 [bacterium P3]KWW42768.1 MAG: hypothetical protein F083_172 [bacterium F083]
MKQQTETSTQGRPATCESYAAPHLKVIPVRCGAAMLVGSMLGMEGDESRRIFHYESQRGEPGNTVAEYTEAPESQGWDNSFI